MTNLDFDRPTRESSTTQSETIAPAGKRVVVLYEPGRTGSAALDSARRLVGGAVTGLTVVSVAPQDTRICCGSGSPTDYNRAVCETAEAELRQARKELGSIAERASFKVTCGGQGSAACCVDRRP